MSIVVVVENVAILMFTFRSSGSMKFVDFCCYVRLLSICLNVTVINSAIKLLKGC